MIKEQYCQNIDPVDADIRFLRCPFEVGFSKNIPQRCADHITNRSTTPIFGLVNAITRQTKAQGGFDFPDVWQLALFPFWIKDKKMAGVAEVFGSMLCSSYWFWGGLNIHPAGLSLYQEGGKQYSDKLWTNGISATLKRLDTYRLHDLQLLHQNDTVESLMTIEDLPRLRAESEKARAEFEAQSELRRENGKKIEEGEAQIEKLQTEIDAQRKINESKYGEIAPHVKSILDNLGTATKAMEAREQALKAEWAKLKGKK